MIGTMLAVGYALVYSVYNFTNWAFDAFMAFGAFMAFTAIAFPDERWDGTYRHVQVSWKPPVVEERVWPFRVMAPSFTTKVKWSPRVGASPPTITWMSESFSSYTLASTDGQAALIQARPELPVEEDGRLNDPVLRENFLTRVFAYAEWRRLQRAGLTRQALIGYHSRYKYQLMATHPLQYQALGRLIAGIGRQPLEELAPRYFEQLMEALKKTATRATHSNVLQHLCGYLKRVLSSAEKQELQQLIDQYRQGTIPLVVPLTLIKHHFRRYPDAYIAQQAYLQPHPAELGLRNAL